MKKSELSNWLQEEYQQWELLLAAIGPKRMNQPGISGEWSMRDIVAHLTGWQQRLAAQMQAALDGQPEPPPPWPADRKTEVEINAWIYETNRKKDLRQVLEDAHRVYLQMQALILGLPADARIETIDSKFHVVYE
ncbi:MAG: ClbS/DfsB family four-helix bundle protein [Holophaga sp.]|nr:ClbS/DfsB family four-helix bundle protein [Holophaga sp.]